LSNEYRYNELKEGEMVINKGVNLLSIRLVKKHPYIYTAIFTILVLCVMNITQVAVHSIDLYQKYLSPLKMSHCAYGVLHKDELRCSEYGKKVISEKGFFKGCLLLTERFVACEKANTELQEKHMTSHRVIFASFGDMSCGMVILLGVGVALIVMSHGDGR
jgi:putative component of membrane protein insertase Oxa1/YidC/SpoIIIJ protein YidD